MAASHERRTPERTGLWPSRQLSCRATLIDFGLLWAMQTNPALVQIFEDMARLTEVLGGNGFKVNAFVKAARVVENLDKDASEFTRSELVALPGVGTGTADRILDFVETGKVADHEDLKARVPAGVVELMGVSGIGPKSAARFWHDAGVESIADLKEAIADGRLEELKGFGKKKVEGIAKSLAFAEKSGGRHRRGVAAAVAGAVAEAARGVEGVERVEVAGSLRRGAETIGDVDVLAAVPGPAPSPEDPTPAPDAAVAAAVFDAVEALDGVAEVLLRGDTKLSVRFEAGLQADVRAVPADCFGAALAYFTGSKEHNVKLRERAGKRGLSLNEYALTEKDGGAVVASETEEEIHEALGLAYVPPELREDRGEVVRAEAAEEAGEPLPRLIETADLKAELHAHTTASDGVLSIDELVEVALSRGFHTLAVTDHSRGQVQANGLSIERLERHIVAVREAAKRWKKKINVLAGSEVDILTDGSLDYPDELLAELDLVVASPHASLSQKPDVATDRLLRAMENPHVTVMGHPTGRLVLKREGLSPDMPRLVKAAAERGVALEINASPYRLDLRDRHVALALEAGCRIAINTDAHGPDGFLNAEHGVATARRGGARAEDVVNTYGREELAAWVASTKR